MFWVILEKDLYIILAKYWLMADQPVFRGVIDFFNQIGIYDVVLPFLLIFTIIFAVLEKTKIFGMEHVGKEEYTKKNLNAIAAFVIAFLFVASSRLVAVVNQAMANVVLLIVVSVSFLMLIGSFFSYKEETFLEKGPWRTSFMVLMTIGVLLIFMHALGWLEPFWDYLLQYWDTSVVGSIVLLIVIVIFMWFVTSGKAPKAEKKE